MTTAAKADPRSQEPSERGASLEVRDLHISFMTRRGLVPAVEGVSFTLQPGERLALVGESGSGKSVTALATLGLLPPNGRVTRGEIVFDSRDLLKLRERAFRKVRGTGLALIFQDPTGSLNPLKTVGSHIAEALAAGRGDETRSGDRRVLELLEQVQIPDPGRRVQQYPHELSGGMNQRVMIAAALAGDPSILVADEPTTALDATTAAGIMNLLGELADERRMSVLLISHDLGVVGEFADNVALMYAGRIVETGNVQDIFRRSRHPYTAGLLRSIPTTERRRQLEPIPGSIPVLTDRPTGCIFHPRCERRNGRAICADAEPPLVNSHDRDGAVACHFSGEQSALRPTLTEDALPTPSPREPLVEVENVSVTFSVRQGLFGSSGLVSAVDDVSFEIRRGETLALVGESGSGKSTLARVVLGLQPPDSGRVVYKGIDLTAARRYPPEVRRRLQAVFQDATGSLDPLMTVAEVVSEPLNVHHVGTRSERLVLAGDALERVGMKREHLSRRAQEFSGGQRQRIAIARALISEPDLIVCDEPVTALDVSVQAQVLKVFASIGASHQISMLFIAHDLGVVRQVADRVAVMYLGRIVEVGDTDQVLAHPAHPYTRALLSAVTSLKPRGTRLREDIILPTIAPSAIAPPPGCRFHPRCWKADAACHESRPPLVRQEDARALACFHPLREPAVHCTEEKSLTT